ncbi:hypothetical protein LshimejAT787_0401470 [Lyophyllum shimeji]|uniref:Uncharacterized protein n=1 Tax=Lyophyllum shimeji TaxID=47721 RepID=A0A9P3PKM0_LYOSH|nr:hypothetical protein LshimejAT787_0401470 [Lyophyllum shimeji]
MNVGRQKFSPLAGIADVTQGWFLLVYAKVEVVGLLPEGLSQSSKYPLLDIFFSRGLGRCLGRKSSKLRVHHALWNNYVLHLPPATLSRTPVTERAFLAMPRLADAHFFDIPTPNPTGFA